MVTHLSMVTHSHTPSNGHIIHLHSSPPNGHTHTHSQFIHSPTNGHTHLPMVTLTSQRSHSPPNGHTHLPMVTLTSQWSHSPPNGHTHLPMVTLTSQWSHSPPNGHTHLSPAYLGYSLQKDCPRVCFLHGAKVRHSLHHLISQGWACTSDGCSPEPFCCAF